MELNIDAVIILSFLLTTLAVGTRHSKDLTSIKDYALGGRNFSDMALVATMVATLASGSGFIIKMGSNAESKAEGRGVGLALCKSAILAHGGKIKVESPGIGALFTIILPLQNYE